MWERIGAIWDDDVTELLIEVHVDHDANDVHVALMSADGAVRLNAKQCHDLALLIQRAERRVS